MPPLQIPLFDLVVPALLALLALSWIWRKRELPPKNSDAARSGGAWAFAIALLAAYASVFREIPFPWGPRQFAAKDWLPSCMVVAAVLATLSPMERVRRLVPGGILALSVALVVMLSMRIDITTGGLSGVLRAFSVFLFAMLTWSALELSCERLRGPMPCLVLALASAGGAVAILAGRNSTFARLDGGLAAVFVAAAIVAWRRRVFTLAGGSVAVVSVLLVSSWINAWAFGSLPLPSVLLLCASIVLPGYAGIGPLSTRRPFEREGARAALTAVLCAAAWWLAESANAAPYGS